MRILNGSLIDVGQAKQHSTVDGIMIQVHVNQGEKEDFDEQVIEDNHKKVDFNGGFDDDAIGDNNNNDLIYDHLSDNGEP